MAGARRIERAWFQRLPKRTCKAGHHSTMRIALAHDRLNLQNRWSLFESQGVDWIQLCGFVGRIKSEDDSDECGEGNRTCD